MLSTPLLTLLAAVGSHCRSMGATGATHEAPDNRRPLVSRRLLVWKALLVIATYPIRGVERPRRGVERTNQKTFPTPRREANQSDSCAPRRGVEAWKTSIMHVLTASAPGTSVDCFVPCRFLDGSL